MRVRFRQTDGLLVKDPLDTRLVKSSRINVLELGDVINCLVLTRSLDWGTRCLWLKWDEVIECVMIDDVG